MILLLSEPVENFLFSKSAQLSLGETVKSYFIKICISGKFLYAYNYIIIVCREFFFFFVSFDNNVVKIYTTIKEFMNFHGFA